MFASPGVLKRQRSLKLLLPYVTGIVIFSIFKLLVPDPWFSKDSWDYINIAWRMDPIAYRPFGYPEFLRIVNGLGGNYNTVIFTQYLLFLFSSALFLEKLYSLFQLNLPAKVFCWCLTIYNPFVFYLCNFFVTDIAFASFTSIWLLSLINFFLVSGKKSYFWLALHLFMYFLLFRLRFNGLYYPAFALLAAFVYKAPVVKKVAVVLLSIILVAGIVNQIQNYTEKVTGTKVYSALGGWAIANNAIHIYQTVDVEDVWADEFSILNKAIVQTKSRVAVTDGITDQYMWQADGPLKSYLFFKLNYTKRQYMEEYFALAPFFEEFGMELIKTYPVAFLKNFYLKNLRNCIIPRLEILDFKLQNLANIDDKGKNYIRFKRAVQPYTQTQIHTVEALKYVYSVINPIIAIAALISVILYIRNWKTATFSLSTLFLLSCFHLIALLLMAFAHPVWIRYLAFNEVFLILVPVAIALHFQSKFSGKLKLSRNIQTAATRA